MPWTEVQRAMLAEMGLWLPPQPASPASPAAPAAPAAPVAASAPAALRARAAAVPAAAPAAPTEPPPRGAPPPLATAAVPPMQAVPPTLDTPDSRARRERIAALGWPALREAVQGCTACALCESRRNPVFGVGHEQAEWLVVGEAPGEQEDLQGQPFVGPSGQLLDRMLAALGLQRGEGSAAQQVYIANTLKCRPPRNRNPEAGEMAQCEPFLQRQIALLRPRIILAMGRFAVHSLLRSSEPIGKLRGRVHQYEGVPLVVTYHPAYLLRSPAEKARAWDDLCLAMLTLRATPPRG